MITVFKIFILGGGGGGGGGGGILSELVLKQCEKGTIKHDLSVTSHINCTDKRCLSHSMCLYQVMMTLHFLNNIANDTESTQK